MPQRRVAVTGVGIVCALGQNQAEVFEALRQGRPGIGPLTGIPPGQLRFGKGAQVQDFPPRGALSAKDLDYLDRFAQFVAVAAREALGDSGLELTADLRRRTAIVLGSSIGGEASHEAAFVDLYKLERGRLHPFTIPRVMPNAGVSRVSMEYGITGPAWTVSTACSSSNHAIGQAFWLVRHGLAEAALAGGSEAPFSLGMLKGWEALRVVSDDTCRPFSADRRGMILGEGGAVLVLEPLEAALARGARIHAEVAGFGMSSDAHHITQPSVEGPAAAMQAALEDAGVAAEAVGYINAHGTGTRLNDPTECAAIRMVFGDHAARLAVSSTKSMHGHALGAAGALEAAITVMALERGLLPPTANFTRPDPECDLDVIPNEPRPAQPEYALSNSFAFGGLNAVLALRRRS